MQDSRNLIVPCYNKFYGMAHVHSIIKLPLDRSLNFKPSSQVHIFAIKINSSIVLKYFYNFLRPFLTEVNFSLVLCWNKSLTDLIWWGETVVVIDIEYKCLIKGIPAKIKVNKYKLIILKAVISEIAFSDEISSFQKKF